MARLSRPHIELHIAVLLAGLTAVLGEVISIGALPLVWWRVLIAALAFIPLYFILEGNSKLNKRTSLQLLAIGGLVGLHWVTFYGSVKLANASVALVCFALVSPLTALLEPLLLGTTFDRTEFLIGCLVLPGMLLVVGVINSAYYAGFAVGLLSALLAAVFATLNKRYVERVRPVDLSLVEMSGAWVSLSILYPLLTLADFGESTGFWPSSADWFYLVVLALLCTTLAFLLATRALQHLTAFTTNLAYALEPVYGILMAAFFLNQHEELNPTFYLGAILIFAAIVAHPILLRKRNSKLD